MKKKLRFCGLLPLSVFIAVSLIVSGLSSCMDKEKKGENGKAECYNREISGDWHFQIDIAGIGEKEKWFDDHYDRSDWAGVEVPGAWNNYDAALWGYEGVGWYSTVIPAGSFPSGKILFLKFNRVNYYTKLWINGLFVGENVGGFLPFGWEVTGLLNPEKDNHLVIRVDNKPKPEWLPGSKQIEWVQYGGILRPVELIARDSVYIEDITVYAVPEEKGARVYCGLKVHCYYPEQRELEVVLRIPAGREEREKTWRIITDSEGSRNFRFSLFLPVVKKWSPGHPALYTLYAEIKEKDKMRDGRKVRFGIRTVKTEGTRILLNDTPLFVKGFNRYDIYGRKGHITDKKLIREDLLRIKQAGANTIRVHYPQSPGTLDLLDETGLLLIEELPLNWWGQNWWWKNETVVRDTAILKQARITLQKMIRRDKNHPCIISWSVANECKTETAAGTYVVSRLIREAHRLDTTRPVTFTVNGETNIQPAYREADFVSCNMYFGNDKAYHIRSLDSLVRIPSEDYIRRQCSYYPHKPVLISEFGAAGIYGVSGDVMFSEDFQAAYIKKAWEAIAAVPQCSGGILWCWADYYHRKYFIQTYAPFGP